MVICRAVRLRMQRGGDLVEQQAREDAHRRDGAAAHAGAGEHVVDARAGLAQRRRR